MESVAVRASVSNTGSDDSVANSTTRTRLPLNDAGADGANRAAAASATTTAAATAATLGRSDRAGVATGAVDPTLWPCLTVATADGASVPSGAATRLFRRSSSSTARVSRDGSTSSSRSSNAANDSYIETAAATSPTDAASRIARRTALSSSCDSASARRAWRTASAARPRVAAASASAHALACTIDRTRARSPLSHSSNSGAPEMKSPAASSPSYR